MKQKHFILFHPVTVFVLTLGALGLSYFYSVHWSIQFNNIIENFTLTWGMNKTVTSGPQTWLMVLTFTILVACIIAGMILIFIYYQKILRLYSLQENFINNFTHELKTPLASIKLYLETFLRHSLPPETQKEFIHIMLQDSDRLQTHIEQILKIGALESKTGEDNSLEFWPIDQVIEEFVEKNAHLFSSIDVNIIRNNIPVPLYSSINRPLFEIMLMNLINNAAKYRSQSDPKLSIIISTKKNKIMIDFQDNGLGISKSEFKKIFKKFYQTENGHTKGTGLGLYICQQIAKIHSGKLTVSSEGQNKGSNFILTIPNKKSLDSQ